MLSGGLSPERCELTDHRQLPNKRLLLSLKAEGSRASLAVTTLAAQQNRRDVMWPMQTGRWQTCLRSVWLLIRAYVWLQHPQLS